MNVTSGGNDATLPLLDIAAFRAGDRSGAAASFVTALRGACHGPGFFLITGHGIAAAQSAAVLDASREFFALPDGDKLAIENVRSPQFRGYTRVGAEQTNGRPDWREQLDLGAERETREPGPGEPPYWRLQGPNQWPPAFPRLREVLLQVAAPRGSGTAGLLDAAPVEGALVCNIGEMFEVATRGYYRATVHRVVSPPPGRKRISVPYFFAPRLDARLEPGKPAPQHRSLRSFSALRGTTRASHA